MTLVFGYFVFVKEVSPIVFGQPLLGHCPFPRKGLFSVLTSTPTCSSRFLIDRKVGSDLRAGQHRMGDVFGFRGRRDDACPDLLPRPGVQDLKEEQVPPRLLLDVDYSRTRYGAGGVVRDRCRCE